MFAKLYKYCCPGCETNYLETFEKDIISTFLLATLTNHFMQEYKDRIKVFIFFHRIRNVPASDRNEMG